jgi:hypothetical protein
MLIYPQHYLKKSISLNELGVDEFAFKKEDALKLIREEFTINYSILGGDVLEITKNNEIIFTYDNWFSDPKADESQENFKTRSRIETEKYISTYNEKDRNIIYSLVFND